MKKTTGTEAIKKMIDEFVMLASVYNIVGLFEHAQNAQAVVVMLNKFEDNHNFVSMAWPPELAANPEDNGGWLIADTEGRPISSEEL